MNTPADYPILVEYLPSLKHLVALEGANISPALEAPDTGAFLAFLDFLVVVFGIFALIFCL